MGDTIASYTWIDNVLLDGMDYFSSTFWFFNAWAFKIAKWVLLIGLLISAIKLLFGAEAIKKIAIGTLGKLLVFFLIMHYYNSIIATISNTALSWGSQAGKGRGTATMNLVSLMNEAKQDLAVAEQLQGLSEKQRKNKIKELRRKAKKAKSMGTGRGNKLTEGLLDPEGASSFANQANLYKNDMEEVINYQVRTLETLKSILVEKIDKDKDGNLIKSYFLNTTLLDNRGNATNYISPASFLKLSILTGKLILKRQADYCDIKLGEATFDEEENASMASKIVSPGLIAFLKTFSFSDIINYMLCFICFLAIFFCAIFVLMQYIMTIFEYSVVTSIVVFYIPFYLADISKQITAKLFPIFWSFFIKLMVITICMWFSLSLYIRLTSDQMGQSTPFDAGVFCTTMFTIMLSFVVTQNAPKISQTILSGNPELSMGELVTAGGTMLAGAILGNKGRKLAQKGAAGVAGGGGRLGGAGYMAFKSAREKGQGMMQSIGAGMMGGGRESLSMLNDGKNRALFGKEGVSFIAAQTAKGVDNQIRREGEHLGSNKATKLEKISSSQARISSTATEQANDPTPRPSTGSSTETKAGNQSMQDRSSNPSRGQTSPMENRMSAMDATHFKNEKAEEKKEDAMKAKFKGKDNVQKT